MNDKELLEGYGLIPTENDKGLTLFKDELHGFNIWMDEGCNILIQHPSFNNHITLDLEIIKPLLNFNNPKNELDHIVIINGEVTLSNSRTFDSGAKINEYYIKYKDGNIKVIQWGDKPLHPKGSQIAVIGTLKENRYKDKDGEWKSTGNQIQAIRIESNTIFTINSMMINGYQLPFEGE